MPLSSERTSIQCSGRPAQPRLLLVLLLVALAAQCGEGPLLWAHGATVRVASVEAARNRFSSFFAEKRRAVIQAMLDAANSTDTVAMLVLTNQEVTTPKVLFDARIVHVIAGENFNHSIPALAPNISFSYPFAIPSSLSVLRNVEEVLVPFETMAMEAGLLAGLATTTKDIALWYSSAYAPEIVAGLVGGVRHVCPLCTVHAYATCSLLTACSGEEDLLTVSAHTTSDVIITSALLTSDMPRAIFARNANESTPVKRSVIAIGNTLDDLTSAVSSSPDFLGCISILQTSAMAGVAAAVMGRFEGGSRQLLYNWTTSFKRDGTDASTKRALSAAVANEFLVQRTLFRGGASVATYDAIGDAALSAEDIGGLPFVPIGYTTFGVDPVVQSLTPGSVGYSLPALGVDQAAHCVFGDRLVVLSADLATLTIYSVPLGKIASVRLDVGDQAYADAAAIPALAPYYNTSRRLQFSNVMPRRGMRCSHIEGELILTGGAYTTSGDVVGSDVLRLFPVCVVPITTECDFFLIENITAEVHDAPSVQRAAGVAWRGADFGMSFGMAASATARFAFVLPNYTATAQPASQLVSVLNLTNTQRYATVALLTLHPPSGVASSTFAPVGVQWVETIPALLALDERRKVVVRVRGAVFNRSQFPAGTAASWEDATVALPAEATPMCLFFNHAVKRIVVVAWRTAAATRQVVVYHYSSHMRVWVLQSTMLPVPNEGVGAAHQQCYPLMAVGGGSALLTPQATLDVSHLVLIWYPAEAPSSCTVVEGEGLSPSLQSCLDCAAMGQDATPDGFCTSKSALEHQVVLPSWAIALVVVSAVAIAAAVAAVVHRHLAERTMLQGRSLENAPPSGTMAVFFLTIADADVMWSGGAKAEMHALIDQLHCALSRSAGANRCYIQSFRGDQATVVGAAAVDVLCVAVEVSLIMSRQGDVPVRLGCGLHVAELVRSCDYGERQPTKSTPGGPRRYLYSGHGLHVCKKAALGSKQGALMATDAFLADVNDNMMKHLGLVRGNTLSLQLDNIMFSARELVLGAILELFQATTAFDDARERRTRILHQKRELTGGTKRKGSTATAGASGIGTALNTRAEHTTSHPLTVPSMLAQARGTAGGDESEPDAPPAPTPAMPWNSHCGEGRGRGTPAAEGATKAMIAANSGVFTAVATQPVQNSGGNLTNSISLSFEQDEVLAGLAITVFRTLLSNLALTARGSEALECIVSRLYIPLRAANPRSSKLPTTIPVTALRALAHRILAMCPRIPEVVALHRGVILAGVSGSFNVEASRPAQWTPMHNRRRVTSTANATTLQTPPKQELGTTPDAMEFSIRSVHNTSSTSVQEQTPVPAATVPNVFDAGTATPVAAEGPLGPHQQITHDDAQPPPLSIEVVVGGGALPTPGAISFAAEEEEASLRSLGPPGGRRRRSLVLSDGTAEPDRSFGTLAYHSSSRTPHQLALSSDAESPQRASIDPHNHSGHPLSLDTDDRPPSP